LATRKLNDQQDAEDDQMLSNLKPSDMKLKIAMLFKANMDKHRNVRESRVKSSAIDIDFTLMNYDNDD
jgi:hypothetical protein